MYFVLLFQEDISPVGSGTVVIRSSISEKLSVSSNQRTMVGITCYLYLYLNSWNHPFVLCITDKFIGGLQSSSNMVTSLEDASTSGTVVFHGQHDYSDSSGTFKSRLGNQERASSASPEDSAINLAEVSFVFCFFFFFFFFFSSDVYINVN